MPCRSSIEPMVRLAPLPFGPPAIAVAFLLLSARRVARKCRPWSRSVGTPPELPRLSSDPAPTPWRVRSGLAGRRSPRGRSGYGVGCPSPPRFVCIPIGARFTRLASPSAGVACVRLEPGCPGLRAADPWGTTARSRDGKGPRDRRPSVRRKNSSVFTFLANRGVLRTTSIDRSGSALESSHDGGAENRVSRNSRDRLQRRERRRLSPAPPSKSRVLRPFSGSRPSPQPP